jgi:hypothetical protein
MHIACLIPKATDMPSEYVILIHFLQQQWLNERASILRYTYTARLLILIILGRKKRYEASKVSASVYVTSRTMVDNYQPFV